MDQRHICVLEPNHEGPHIATKQDIVVAWGFNHNGAWKWEKGTERTE